MKSYILSFKSGAISEFFANSDREAISIVMDMLVAGWTDRHWCEDGQNDYGSPCKRLFFWSTWTIPSLATSDTAIAQLSTLGYVSSTGF